MHQGLKEQLLCCSLRLHLIIQVFFVVKRGTYLSGFVHANHVFAAARTVSWLENLYHCSLNLADIIAISHETRGCQKWCAGLWIPVSYQRGIGRLKGQLPFKFDIIYSVKYMYSEIISTDVAENYEISEALHRTTSSIAIDMGSSN